jgi:magnesium transporter
MAETHDKARADALASDALHDEEGAIRADFVHSVAAAIAVGDSERVRKLAADMHEADLGALIEALDADERPKLIELMGRDFDFAALTEVDDSVREEILDELPTETVAEGMRELETDDAVEILEDLEPEEQAEILEKMPAVERVALRRSLDYPEDSAGRLMQATLVTAPPLWTAGQMIDHLGDIDPDDLPDSFFEIFVVDPGHRLLGNVFLDTLLKARRTTRLEDILDADRRRVRVTEDREEVARLFQRYNLVSAPVVDEGDRLVGVITIDDVVDVIQEEAEEDIKALGGVSRSEDLSDTVLWIAKSRFTWLFVNLITAFVASSVLGLFAGEMQKMVATRELFSGNLQRVMTREVTVGLLNGVAFGIMTGVVAGAWFGSVGIGVVISLAMLTNLVAGALGGILIPVVLDKHGFDPAVSSGAFVTTVTDVVGNFAFMGIATLWFGLA